MLHAAHSSESMKSRDMPKFKWITYESRGGFGDEYATISWQIGGAPVITCKMKAASGTYYSKFSVPKGTINRLFALKVNELPPLVDTSGEENFLDAPIVAITFHYSDHDVRVLRDYRRHEHYERSFERCERIFEKLFVEAAKRAKKES